MPLGLFCSCHRSVRITPDHGLAANVGAMPIDFARLAWSRLVLVGDLPLCREERAKPAHPL
jgi:hypothetical protein